MISKLFKTPQAFSFFQAIRLLEIAARLQSAPGPRTRLGKAPAVGGFTPPQQELLRLGSSHLLRFPEAEIEALVKHEAASQPAWNMTVNFLGLTGAAGVLPFHYTELVLQRSKAKDEALRSFLDLFNHRTLSLFYRAATKYRLPLAYEKGLTAGPDKAARDSHTRALLSLIGLGTGGLDDRMQIRDESLIFYGGLLTKQVRTASGLRQMLQDYFEVPVGIEEFLGSWEKIMPDARTRLASRAAPKGQNARLGRSIVFGQKGWFAQGKLRIRIGPLNRPQFQNFAPGSRTLQALNEMVRFYLGAGTDYDFVIEVDRRHLSDKVALGKKAKPIMGWNTWLGGSGLQKNSKGAILAIRVPPLYRNSPLNGRLQ